MNADKSIRGDLDELRQHLGVLTDGKWEPRKDLWAAAHVLTTLAALATSGLLALERFNVI